MYIYSIYPKDGTKTVYIGKTNNVTQRMYAHKACLKDGAQLKYAWMRAIGWENLEHKVEEIYADVGQDRESVYIEKYKQSGYKVINEQLNDYRPNPHYYFKDREQVWEVYSTTDIDRKAICEQFRISDSLLSKIIIEHGGTTRMGKLFGHYEEIQQLIISGVPIKRLSKIYGVRDNAIRNINCGTTAYDPNLNYPLNQFVAEQIQLESRFKPKV